MVRCPHCQFESTDRFLRPTDVDRVRRNYRSIQVRQLIVVLRNGVLLLAAIVALVVLYRRTQSDGRWEPGQARRAGR